MCLCLGSGLGLCRGKGGTRELIGVGWAQRLREECRIRCLMRGVLCMMYGVNRNING